MSKNKLKKRLNISRLSNSRCRLSIFRSNKNIVAQIIDDFTRKTLVSASSLELKKTICAETSALVGKLLAEKALKQKITKIYFDRKSKSYSGNIKILCDNARETGLDF